MSRLPWEARHDKQRALVARDAECADSVAVRHALLERVRKGEITLAESQAELKRLQRNAKKNGKTTRAKVWRQS